jgi:hypothetical protein
VRQKRFKPATSWLDIFDWRFEKYLTPWIVRITWLVCLAVASIWLASILFFTLRSWLPERDSSEPPRQVLRPPSQTFEERSSFPPMWLTSRVASTIAGFTGACFVVIVVLWIRVLLETAIVLFNIATTLTSIDEKTASP